LLVEEVVQVLIPLEEQEEAAQAKLEVVVSSVMVC